MEAKAEARTPRGPECAIPVDAHTSDIEPPVEFSRPNTSPCPGLRAHVIPRDSDQLSYVIHPDLPAPRESPLAPPCVPAAMDPGPYTNHQPGPYTNQPVRAPPSHSVLPGSEQEAAFSAPTPPRTSDAPQEPKDSRHTDDVRIPCTDSTTPPQQPDGPPGQGSGKRRCWTPSLRPLGAAVDRFLLCVFGAIARAVAARPVLTLALSICAGLAMASGLVFLKSVDDFNALYNPPDTEASTDLAYVYSMYPIQPQVVRIILVSPPGDQQDTASSATNSDGSSSGGSSGGNLLTKPALLAFMDVFDALRALNGGTPTALGAPTVCHRPEVLPSSPCRVASVLDFWRHNRTALMADPDVLGTINRGAAHNDVGDPIVTQDVMGGVQRDPQSGVILGAAALQLTLWLEVSPEADAWQQGAVPLVQAMQPPEGTEVYIYSTWHYNKTSNDETYGDLPLVIAGFALILVYCVMLLFRPHPVYSRVSFALANIASILLAVASTVGLCSYAGLGFSLVGQVLPLLLLGLGTDDMLVTLAADGEIARESPGLGTQEHVVRTVTRARRCIVVATVTNVAVFLTGISSTLPALRDFMIFSAVGISLLLAFQSTFFVACLTLSHRRQLANRWDLLCCVTSSSAHSDGCCGIRYSDTPSSPSSSWVHCAVGHYLPRLILHPAGMAFVIAATVALAVLGSVGTALVQSSFHPDYFVPSATYDGQVIAVRDQYFPSKGVSFVGVYVTFPTPSDAGWGPSALRKQPQELQALADAFSPENNSLVAPGTLRAWYPAYLGWLGETPAYSGHSAQDLLESPAALGASLQAFLNSSEGARYRTDIVLATASSSAPADGPGVGPSSSKTGSVNGSGSGTTTWLVSARYIFFTVNLPDSEAQVEAMDAFRRTAADAAPALHGIAYGDDFVSFEGYAVIWGETVTALAIASSVVFVLMLLMLADLVASLLVGASVALVNVELLGFIHWLGLTFNLVTSLTLLLGLGIAVDYAAFIAYSFLTQQGTRRGRAAKALDHLGEAVFNGGLTMFLAVVLVCFARSYVFLTFFKMFSLIVLLGLWHGLVALPVVLALVGPRPYTYSEAQDLAKLSMRCECSNRTHHVNSIPNESMCS